MQERNNKVMKKLDRYIGCPLVYVLGHLRKKNSFPVLPSQPRILLLKTAAIGDTILMEAIIHEIKSAYPQSSITFVCSKSNIAMVKMLPDIDEVILFQMKKPFISLCQISKMDTFDLLLDFGPWPRINSVISYFAPARFKIGFERKNMYRHYVYDAPVEHRDDLHEMDNYRNILRRAKIKINGYNPCLPVEQKKILPYKDYIVFHMFPGGSSVLLRSWSDENWLALGHELQKRYECPIIFAGGPEDTAKAEQMADLFEKEGISASSVAAKYPLSQMPSLLGQAKMVISVNTGIMHMSAAVGVPLIALHGATSDLRWGPLSDKAIVVKSGENCQPCISLGFESHCQNPKCMEHITVDMVLEKIDELGRRLQK